VEQALALCRAAVTLADEAPAPRPTLMGEIR